MSTLFDSYYDCLGHELTYGSKVGFRKGNRFIYGTVVDIVSDAKSGYKFIVAPTIGYTGKEPIKLQAKYKVGNNRVFLINVLSKE